MDNSELRKRHPWSMGHQNKFKLGIKFYISFGALVILMMFIIKSASKEKRSVFILFLRGIGVAKLRTRSK